ncbi:FAD-binding oxidoreductase [Pseudomonas entomophila]|uniref:NAD(P)/FAD-dependent oxidoreductase n=1 Tax=Pseudomonas entomophila TaxID=312306 RepID=UPI001BCCE971|nr:FAD-binding oxidoreductase [Pseudomonas entomophila]QVM89741.1 FAD-binding oxidoreductase [Pseudomonas entomophila]
MSQGDGMRVIVVGAGIVGASIAYHLARKGARVTVVEASEIASGVTGRSFAWINTCAAGPEAIAPLRNAAIDDYRRLERELPGLVVRWTGSLCYAQPSLAEPDTSSTVVVSRQRIRDLEPNLRHPPEQAMHAPQEGALDAVAATHALIAGAKAHGATVLTQTQVLGMRFDGGTLSGVNTSQGPLAADRVVLAAGNGCATLAGALGVPLAIGPSPALFIRYRARPGLVRGIISNAAMEVRQGAEGWLLAAEDYLGDGPEHQPEVVARRTAEAICGELEGVGALELETACVGWRPMPENGIPLIGDVPGVSGVYLCVMHPGVTLAAVVGRLVSEEIVDGKTHTHLVPCRPV